MRLLKWLRQKWYERRVSKEYDRALSPDFVPSALIGAIHDPIQRGMMFELAYSLRKQGFLRLPAPERARLIAEAHQKAIWEDFGFEIERLWIEYCWPVWRKNIFCPASEGVEKLLKQAKRGGEA